MNYKTKYLKYKKKYLLLKRLRQLNKKEIKIGGGTLLEINAYYDKNEFIQFYNAEVNDNTKHKGENHTKTSFQFLANLLDKFTKYGNVSGEINMLVGASNKHENDYFRFFESPFYSLYLDDSDENFNAERQFHMYTINYDKLINDRVNLSKFHNKISEIHFDTNVSDKIPLNFLEIAQYILMPGGRIIWNLQFGQEALCEYDINNHRITTIGKNSLFDPTKNYVSIDLENKLINADINYFANPNIKISPYFQEKIYYVEGTKIKYFKNNFDTQEFRDQFLGNCMGLFPNFEFEIIEYSYANYLYPVPIKLIKNRENKLMIETDSNIVNNIFNKVMSDEEKQNYINNKRIDEGLIYEFSYIILSNRNLHQIFKNKLEHELIGEIYTEFYKPMYYVVSTKIT